MSDGEQSICTRLTKARRSLFLSRYLESCSLRQDQIPASLNETTDS